MVLMRVDLGFDQQTVCRDGGMRRHTSRPSCPLGNFQLPPLECADPRAITPAFGVCNGWSRRYGSLVAPCKMGWARGRRGGFAEADRGRVAVVPHLCRILIGGSAQFYGRSLSSVTQDVLDPRP